MVPLVKAVQELKAEIDELKDTIHLLIQRIEALESK